MRHWSFRDSFAPYCGEFASLTRPFDRLPLYNQHGHVVAPAFRISHFRYHFLRSRSAAVAHEPHKAISNAPPHWSRLNDVGALWSATLCRLPADLTRLAVREVASRAPAWSRYLAAQLGHQRASLVCFVLPYLGPQGRKSQRDVWKAIENLCERDLNVCLQSSPRWLSRMCHCVQSVPYCTAHQDAVGTML